MLKELGDEYLAEIEHLTKEILQDAGEDFNIKSPKQLGEILFEKMNLPHGKKNKTGYSTDANTLLLVSSFPSSSLTSLKNQNQLLGMFQLSIFYVIARDSLKS